MLDLALLILRLVIGGIFVAHGMQKLFGSFGGGGIQGTAGFFDQVGIRPARPMVLLAGLSEFVGGLLLILGFLTPLAAIALIITMIVAVVFVHLPNGFFSSNGGYEYNLALAVVALFLLLAGPGVVSLDNLFGFFW